VWEETGVPGENPRDRAGDDRDLPTYDIGIEPGYIGEKRLHFL